MYAIASETKNVSLNVSALKRCAIVVINFFPALPVVCRLGTRMKMKNSSYFLNEKKGKLKVGFLCKSCINYNMSRSFEILVHMINFLNFVFTFPK